MDNITISIGRYEALVALEERVAIFKELLKTCEYTSDAERIAKTLFGEE